MSTNSPTLAERFVKSLGTLSRGEIATLKRSAGHTLGESRGAMSVFYRHYPVGPDDRDEEVFFLVATLFGFNKFSLTGNFGNTMRHIRPPVDRRMTILLNSEFDLIDGYKPGGGELAYRLRQCVRMAASKNVGVDWLQLINDLRYWGHPVKRSRKTWARSYFGRLANTE